MIFRKKRKVLRKRTRFSLNSKKVIILLSVVLLIFFGFIFLKVTKISRIEVVANNAPCIDTKYIRGSSLILGKNTFKLKEDEVISELRKKYFCIKDIRLKKDSLSSIKLEIFGRNPALILNLIPEEKLDLEVVQATASALIKQQPNFDVIDSSISGQLIVDKD